jgi:hypothetical protein
LLGQTANLQEWQDPLGNALSVVDANGNFGIGTSSPARSVHLVGSSAVFRMDRNADSSAFILVRTDPTFATVWKTFYVGVNASSVGTGSFVIEDAGTAVGGVATIRFVIDNTGKVGIGTSSPAYPLDVAGQVHATGFPTSSDMRFKEDIQPIDDALDKVLQLQGVYFKWNHLHRETLKRSSTLTSRQVGLIAQQVKEVLPEVVSEWADQGAEDYLAIDYSRLAAVTIEAIKELKSENNMLRERIATLERKLAAS